MADYRIDRDNWFTRLKRNIIKVWQVIYVPMQYFFVGEGGKEKNEEAKREAEEAELKAQQEAQAQAAAAQTKSEPEAEPEPEQEPGNDAESEPEPEPEEEEPSLDDLNDDDAALAAEIIARLQAEADADAAAKQAEIDAARQFAENKEDDTFNATTNSFSGQYGTGPVDDDTMDAVSAILKQNDRSGVEDLLN